MKIYALILGSRLKKVRFYVSEILTVFRRISKKSIKMVDFGEIKAKMTNKTYSIRIYLHPVDILFDINAV